MKESASSETKEKIDGLKRRHYVGDGSGERKREVRKGKRGLIPTWGLQDNIAPFPVILSRPWRLISGMVLHNGKSSRQT